MPRTLKSKSNARSEMGISGKNHKKCKGNSFVKKYRQRFPIYLYYNSAFYVVSLACLLSYSSITRSR